MSSMTAERDAYINVTSDGSALVQLMPGDSDRVYEGENGELGIDFGSGVNTNAVYQVGSVKFSGIDGELSGENIADVAPEPDMGTSPSSQGAFFIQNGDETAQEVTFEYAFDDEASPGGSRVIFGSRVDSNQSGGVVGSGSPSKAMTADAETPNPSITYDGDDALSPGAHIGVTLLIDTRGGSPEDDLSGSLTVSVKEV